MFLIEDILVSPEIFEKKFCCDLAACKGACCVEGEYGAPLLEAEIEILESLAEQVAPVLDEVGRQTLEEKGAVVYYDGMDECGTTLRPDRACVFTVFDALGRASCGIEKLYQAGEVEFRKPISCYLYPIRVSRVPEAGFVALNYEEWDICKPALKKGSELGLPLIEFLKDALILGFGAEFYAALEEAYKHYRENDQ